MEFAEVVKFNTLEEIVGRTVKVGFVAEVAEFQSKFIFDGSEFVSFNDVLPQNFDISNMIIWDDPSINIVFEPAEESIESIFYYEIYDDNSNELLKYNAIFYNIYGIDKKICIIAKDMGYFDIIEFIKERQTISFDLIDQTSTIEHLSLLSTNVYGIYQNFNNAYYYVATYKYIPIIYQKLTCEYERITKINDGVIIRTRLYRIKSAPVVKATDKNKLTHASDDAPDDVEYNSMMNYYESIINSKEDDDDKEDDKDILSSSETISYMNNMTNSSHNITPRMALIVVMNTIPNNYEKYLKRGDVMIVENNNYVYDGEKFIKFYTYLPKTFTIYDNITWHHYQKISVTINLKDGVLKSNRKINNIIDSIEFDSYLYEFPNIQYPICIIRKHDKYDVHDFITSTNNFHWYEKWNSIRYAIDNNYKGHIQVYELSYDNPISYDNPNLYDNPNSTYIHPSLFEDSYNANIPKIVEVKEENTGYLNSSLTSSNHHIQKNIQNMDSKWRLFAIHDIECKYAREPVYKNKDRKIQYGDVVNVTDDYETKKYFVSYDENDTGLSNPIFTNFSNLIELDILRGTLWGNIDCLYKYDFLKPVFKYDKVINYRGDPHSKFYIRDKNTAVLIVNLISHNPEILMNFVKISDEYILTYLGIQKGFPVYKLILDSTKYQEFVLMMEY